MGSIEVFKKDGAVEFDGQALEVVAHLSNIAKNLYELQQRDMPPDVRKEVAKACKSLDVIVKALTAINETVEYMEVHVESILSIIDDGCNADFNNAATSVHFMIAGYLIRKRSTIRVQTFLLHEKPNSLGSNDNGRKNGSFEIIKTR